MSTIQFRKPVARALHRKNWSRPDGNFDFRVTQRYDDLDSYWSNADPDKAKQKHHATDIGNFLCGDPILSMAAGTVVLLEDNAKDYGAATNALGVRVIHHPRFWTEYWHLDTRTVREGQQVPAGHPIGRLGKTGLGNVCHTHITGVLDGALIDVEELMFGDSLTITEKGEEDMRFSGAELKVVRGAKDSFRLLFGSNLREGPTRQSASLGVLPAGTVCYGSFSVTGESINGNDQWIPTFQYTGAAYVLGFYHTSVLEEVPEPEATPVPADCTKEVLGATNTEKARWLTWLNSRPK